MKHILVHVYDAAIVGLYTNDSAMFSYFPISMGKIFNCRARHGLVYTVTQLKQQLILSSHVKSWLTGDTVPLSILFKRPTQERDRLQAESLLFRISSHLVFGIWSPFRFEHKISGIVHSMKD